MKKLFIMLLVLGLGALLFSCGCGHTDADKDGVCDLCQSAIGDCTHVDDNVDYECDKCGATLSASPCSHIYLRIDVEESTCTRGSIYYNKCTQCGEVTENFESGEGHGHTWVKSLTEDCLVTPASCENAAMYAHKCSECGSTDGLRYSEGEPLGHTIVREANSETFREAATCAHPAIYAEMCTTCGEDVGTFELGGRLNHVDTHGDWVCDYCETPLEEWGDIPSDNNTDIAPLSKEED
jgi:hypothetical protein